MKKTLLTFTVISACSLQLQAQTKITNNAITVINSGNSVTCNAGGIISTDNSFFQIYDLENYANITDTAFFVKMKVGAEETSGGAYNIVGAVYTIQGTANLANLTFISDDTIAIYPDSTLYLIDIPFDQGYALPNDSLASELKLPMNATASFFPASNTSPEIGYTYIVAAGCSIADMTTMTSIGFPDMHIIMHLYVNQKPQLASIARSTFKDQNLDFVASDFQDVYTDNDSDTLNMLKVFAVPANGVLDLDGTTLAVGDTIWSTELDSLTYIPNAGFSGTDQFTVLARDNNHWSNTYTDVDITIYNWQAGIMETESPSLNVYPNPTSSQITLVVTSPVSQIRIFDESGKLVQSQSGNSLSLSVEGLEAGNYFMEVVTESGVYTSRFVKQ